MATFHSRADVVSNIITTQAIISVSARAVVTRSETALNCVLTVPTRKEENINILSQRSQMSNAIDKAGCCCHTKYTRKKYDFSKTIRNIAFTTKLVRRFTVRASAVTM